LVNNTVRKFLSSAAARTFGQRSPRLWKLKDSFQRAFNFFCKIIAQSSFLLVVVIDSFFEFLFGNGQKFDLHRDDFPRILSKTSFAGLAPISPRSYASIRSSTSSAHNPSMDWSGGNSKLDRSFSIKSARSFGESDKASENIFSAVSDMTRSIFLNIIR